MGKWLSSVGGKWSLKCVCMTCILGGSRWSPPFKRLAVQGVGPEVIRMAAFYGATRMRCGRSGWESMLLARTAWSLGLGEEACPHVAGEFKPGQPSYLLLNHLRSRSHLFARGFGLRGVKPFGQILGR